MSRQPTVTTVLEHIAWSYANLARAHAALSDGAHRYTTVHHMIRARLYKGLTTGTLRMRSLYDDEAVKMAHPHSCCYCGAVCALSRDHLVPRLRGGADEADNLVWACRPCNSAKGARDLLEWFQQQHRFPPLLLLRRYLKLVARHCDAHGVLVLPLASAAEHQLPFRLDLLPYEFPPPNETVLWATAPST